MKSHNALRVAAVLLLGTALIAVPALAQGQRRGGMGMPRYDKTTEQTVSGTVQKVEAHEGRMGAGTGVHLAFTTGDRVLDVHVGPARWLTEKQYEFTAGDRLTITGSSVKVDGADAFLAREIVKDGKTLVLRNADGVPLWSGRGGRTR